MEPEEAFAQEDLATDLTALLDDAVSAVSFFLLSFLLLHFDFFFFFPLFLFIVYLRGKRYISGWANDPRMQCER